MFAKVGRSLLRLLRPQQVVEAAPAQGARTALDGATAVAVVESFLAEAACFGGSAGESPAAGMERAWREEWAREGRNLVGGALGGVPGHGPRAAVAAALGLTLAGRRAAVFVDGGELAGVADLIAHAVGRRAPLVVHVVARAWATHGPSTGSGHEAWHAISETGAVLLYARSVQDAVDLTLVARRLAEQALVPVVVGMDDAETARAVQDLVLPDANLVRAWLGAASDRVPCPTPAQQLLFGAERHRVPRWFDAERPALLGAHQAAETWALGAAAGAAWFGEAVPGLLDAALHDLAEATGRRPARVVGWDLRDAELVVVAMGALVEQARATALHLRREGGPRVGVVGLTCLRPFPAAELRSLLGAHATVAVLERTAAALPGDPPLARELRGTLVAMGTRIVPVLAGLGGLPVRATDLGALFRTLAVDSERPRVFLGLELHHERDPWPKRQPTMDAMRRAWPEIARLGVRGREPLDARPEEALTVEVHQGALDHGTADGLADRIAAVLRELSGGSVRGRPGHTGQRWDGPRVDRFTWAPEPFADPGDDTPCEAVVLAGARPHSLPQALQRLQSHGAVLVEVDDARGGALPPGLEQALNGSGAGVCLIDPEAGARRGPLAQERLLGASLGMLLTRGLLRAEVPRLVAARRALLEEGADVDARLAAFESGLREVRELDAVHTAPAQRAPVELPLVIRHFRRTDRTWDNVPLFWDQVGAVWRDGGPDALVADPYMATGALPPLTSTFRDLSAARETMPAWTPERCTGCGSCWTACPEGAVGPTVLSGEALLRAGMAMAAEAGTRADALSAVVKPLAGRVTRHLREGATLPAALEAAGAWLQEKGGLPADRQAAVADALAAVGGQLAAVPAAITAPFHDEPEAARKGAGELLTIAINPDTCKGCQACAAACEDAAMTIEPQDPGRVQAARATWRAWERLPDTAGATIERARLHPEVGPLAAVLLSRTCLLAMIGGDSAEAGSGERLAVRASLALLEAHLQPRVQAHLAELAALRDRLQEQARRGPAPGKVDTARVDELMARDAELAELAWRVGQGPDGLGRARAGLAFAGDTVSSWAGAFPHNPFSCPAIVDLTGEAGALARGLVEATVRGFVEDLAIVRRARKALGEAVEVPTRWSELSPADRALCPPVFLVGTDRAMVGDGFGRIAALLGSDLPIKVLLLADLDLGLGARGDLALPPDDPPGELSLLALGHRRAVVAQSSAGEHDHLARCLDAAVAWPGPALLRVHAASPSRHGYPTAETVAQSRRAVASRAFPLFLLRPDGPGAFGSRLDLAGNPAPEAVHGADAQGAPFTVGDWARTEGRFAWHYTPGDGTPLHRGLVDGAGPFTVDGPDGPLRVSPALVAAARERTRTWRTLQELAGVQSPFVDDVRAAVQAELAGAHARQLDELRSQHADEQQRLRGEVTAEVAVRVRQRLLHLAGYRGVAGGEA